MLQQLGDLLMRGERTAFPRLCPANLNTGQAKSASENQVLAILVVVVLVLVLGFFRAFRGRGRRRERGGTWHRSFFRQALRNLSDHPSDCLPIQAAVIA